jgi:NADH-quinone oxidoreductase subunit G
VWYLDRAKSICAGCARGCNIEFHTSQRRTHHNQGRRIARIKPRENPEVNQWWICDAGRYGFRWMDDERRLTAPRRRDGGRASETTWAEAIGGLADALRRHSPHEIGILGSPQLANEDLWLLRQIADHLGVHRDFDVPPREPGDQDDFLIRADKNPNRRGAELIGLGPAAGGPDARGILAGAAAGRIKLLWVLHHDLLASAWPAAEVRAALGGAQTLVFQGPLGHQALAGAHLLLPSAAYAEREGTFTNFRGRVQRFRVALPPLGEALPDWDILGRVGRALGLTDPAFQATRVEQVFRQLVAAVPAFTGLSYRSLGDAGQLAGGPAGPE